MWKFTSILFVLFLSTFASAQNWQWTELDTMPFRTANNAVCEANVNGNEFVYSFGGIDTTKLYSGIHKRSFKYEVSSDTWTEIDPLPDAEAKIASGASFVKGKIYVLGGYHVYSNNSEVSSNKVHVYNPQTDSYEADGSSIPLAIDDHVQCVYKDSLIFVVTGWSNNGNYPNVQIYNPSMDQWQNGTFVPSSFQYTAFGASGAIIGDTLYYHGGAAGGSFAARDFVRKGYINPQDPTDITWELIGSAPGDDGYRSACSYKDNTIFWIGGSPKSYNYNGVAYDGSGGVNPSARILHFNNSSYHYMDETSQPYGVMDLRGVAKLSNDKWIVCGGMDTNQVVSNRTFLLESSSLSTEELDEFDSALVVKYTQSKVTIESEVEGSAFVTSIDGKRILSLGEQNVFELNRDEFISGMYLFVQGSFSTTIRL